jgi:hypothetical protein
VNNFNVPAAPELVVEIDGGSLSLRVSTSGNIDGSIDARGRFDRLHLTTDDGQIEVEALAGSRMASRWELHTGDGSITIRLPRDFAADLDAATGDGHIRIDLPFTSAKFDEACVRGKLNGGGPLLTLHTDDGSIEIEPL